jgi:hypothetical protein
MKPRPKTLDDLTPDPFNARIHPERNREMIAQSLREAGAFRSIAVDADGVVRAGNGVLRLVDARPDELVAVRRRDLRGGRWKSIGERDGNVIYSIPNPPTI